MKPEDMPEDLSAGGRGRRLWERVAEGYELRPDEVEELVEACRMLDEVDRLAGIVADDGYVVSGSRGQVTVNPVAVELRQLRETLRKTLAALNLPDHVEAEARRWDARSVKARAAAQKRWGTAQ